MVPTRADLTGRSHARRLSRRRALQTGGLAALGAGLARVSATGAQDNLATPPAATPFASPAASPEAGMGVTPERVRAAIEALDGVADDALAATGVPGLAVAVVYEDQPVFLQGYGVREAGTSDAVDADTVFQLASVSKPIASTVLASAIGRGVATWDTPITHLTPEFALHDAWPTAEVTLRDMFAHRSGLPEHAGDLLEDIGYDRTAVLHRLRYQEPETSFRSGYAYTNFGLTAAAEAVAVAAGQPWEDLAAERLYRPLGMTRTSSRFADFAAAANRAFGHVLLDGAWQAKYVRQPDAQSPAGGVSSTVRDLAQWLRLQLGGGTFAGQPVVDAAALAQTHVPHMVSRPPEDPNRDRAGFYGLGWNVGYDDEGRLLLSHSGAFALGAATTVFLLPADGLGIAVLTNGTPIGLPESVALGFLDLARFGQIQNDYLAVLGPIFAAMNAPPYGTLVDYNTPPASLEPPLAPEAYVGTYANELYGDAEVEAATDALVLRLGPNRVPFPLRHYDRDIFTYQPVGENAYGPSGVTFTIGPDGRASDVVVENLDIHGQGTFSRIPPEA